MPGFLTIAVGSQWTPPYFNPRADYPIWIVAPRSINTAECRLQAAVSSGASAAGDAFGDVALRLQPSGFGQFTVFSTGNNTTPLFFGPILCPTPFLRIWVSTAATVVNTYTVLQGRMTD